MNAYCWIPHQNITKYSIFIFQENVILTKPVKIKTIEKDRRWCSIKVLFLILYQSYELLRINRFVFAGIFIPDKKPLKILKAFNKLPIKEQYGKSEDMFYRL